MENYIFQKIRSGITDYLHSSPLLPIGTEGQKCPYHAFTTFSSFPPLNILHKLREIKLKMISVISFDWLADFGKTLIQR